MYWGDYSDHKTLKILLAENVNGTLELHKACNYV